MGYNMLPNFRGGEDEEYCSALPVYEEERLKESSEDYILPDYLPDVRKIVAVFPDAVLKGRFMGSGTLEYEGEVRFKILYIAEDKSIKSALFITGFEDKVGNEELTQDCVDLITPVCENANVRLLNPRKLNIRCMCGVKIKVYKRYCALPQLFGALTVEDEARLQCKVEKVAGMNVLNLRENGLTLSEDLNFEAAMPSATDFLFGRAMPSVQDCRVFEGEAQIRGAVDIYCLVSTGTDAESREELLPLTFSLPFSQTVKNEGLHEGGECFCRLIPEGCEFRLRDDEFGQKRVVEFDMTYLCDLTVYYPKEVLYLSDAYSLEKETELSRSEKSFYCLSAPLKGSFSVNESAVLDLPEEGGFTLVQAYLFPELHLSKEKDKDGKAVLEGNCGISLLLRDSAGSPDVRRTSVPLRFKTEKTAEEGQEGEMVCKVSGVRCRLDKNVLTCDFEVGFFGQLLCRKAIDGVDILRIQREARAKPGKRGSIILCFPEKDELLFDIAKRYGVTVDSLSGGTDAQKEADQSKNQNERRKNEATAKAGVPLFILCK